MASEELKRRLCQRCNEQFPDEPCEPSECALLAVIENAVEIPDCKKCIFNYTLAWHQCERCFGEATNNFVPKEEVHDGK